MSLGRLVYYCGLFSGWAAFVGWLAAEVLVLRGDGARGGLIGLAIVGGLVGAAIGAGLNMAAGWSSSPWSKLRIRILVGFIGGGLGGLLGILAGNLAYTTIHLPRFIGFMLLGLAVGVVDGMTDRSLRKIRNGVMGGLVGGLVGGVLFNPLAAVLQSDSGIASRATAFVILGSCVGALIGLTQVVLREAWLTVLDGYRPGRQLILSRDVTTLGRGDHLQLPFIGAGNLDLEVEHCRIVRQHDGSYQLEDLNSRSGTTLNRQRLSSSSPLSDGDVIKLGTNHVRFNERRRRAGQSPSAGGVSTTPATAKPPPAPPAPPKNLAPTVPTISPSSASSSPPTPVKSAPTVLPTATPAPPPPPQKRHSPPAPETKTANRAAPLPTPSGSLQRSPAPKPTLPPPPPPPIPPSKPKS